MLGNFRNKDTLQIFNERWKANHNINKKIINSKNNTLKSYTPSAQARRVTGNIRNNNIMRGDILNNFKRND